jgi:hypothetical protein
MGSRFFEIFCDSRIEGSWLQSLSPLLKAATLRQIGDRGKNPEAIEKLISYDRPDVIVLHDGSPILVVEKTKEVPTGHNVGQRMARLVKAAELRVPFIYKMPFDARKHGRHSNICRLNIRVISALERISEIHKVPAIALPTAIDRNGEILKHSPCDAQVSAILANYLINFDFSAFGAAQAFMRSEYKKRLAIRAAYGLPPKTVSIVKSRQLETIVGYRVDFLNRREESVLYTIGMNPEKCRREDPYTGTQFIYDYTMCRTGVLAADKSRNLVLSFPKITKNRWLAANPIDGNRKSCNWYLTASAILLSDGYIDVKEGALLAK